MKTIIVDDERLARNELKRLLEEFPKINIVAEAANAESMSIIRTFFFWTFRCRVKTDLSFWKP
jgi:DNA-binding LytR/AlgR family response regulator